MPGSAALTTARRTAQNRISIVNQGSGGGDVRFLGLPTTVCHNPPSSKIFIKSIALKRPASARLRLPSSTVDYRNLSPQDGRDDGREELGGQMPKQVAGLAARQVETIGDPGLVADGGGLYLRITPSGGKSWVFRFQLDGKRRDMGLGPYPDVGLASAREKARECRRLRLEGVDPIETRRAKRGAQRLADAKAMTFRQCAEAYIAAHRAGWRNPKHAAQWPSTLAKLCLPEIRRFAGAGNRRRAGHAGARADLDPKARNREPGARPDRKHPRLGNGARLSTGRKPGALARASGKPVAAALQGPLASNITRRSPMAICRHS